MSPLNPPRSPHQRGERGALSLELAILGPVLILVLLLMASAGRIYLAGSGVDDAARDAARAASLQRDPDAARAAALSIADQTLAAQGLHCLSTDVEVPVGGFNTPLGQPASVTVTVHCRVDLSQVAVPGMPGSKVLTGSFTSSIDRYRQRSAAPASTVVTSYSASRRVDERAA